MRERAKVITVLIVIILIISIVGIAQIPKKDDTSKITGLEGYAKAKEVALDWNEETQLHHVLPMNYTISGTENRWLYFFYIPSSIENYTIHLASGATAQGGYQYDTLNVLVCSNGTISNYSQKRAFSYMLTSFINWKIDTDEAYQIATSDGFNDYIEENSEITGENLTKIRHTEEATSIEYKDGQLSITIRIYVTFWDWTIEEYYWCISAENGEILDTNFIEN